MKKNLTVYTYRLVATVIFGLFVSASLLTQPIHAAAPDSPAEQNVAKTRMLEPWQGDLDGMVERRYIRVLVVPNRMSYFLDKGEPHGLSYELIRAFEEALNQQLDTGAVRVNVAIIPTSREKLLISLLAGRGDIAVANLTITPERSRQVDFSTPLLRHVKPVLVTDSSIAALTDRSALSGQTIWVPPTSSFVANLEALSEELTAAGMGSIDIRAADPQLEQEDLLELVNAGVLPATIADDHVANFWASVFDNLRVHGDVSLGSEDDIGWAVRKGSPQLLSAINSFVSENRKGTLIGNILFKRYLKNNQWVKNAGSDTERARFEATVELFRTYGDKYNLPWLLVAAQAYQESGIDQSKQNPSGAVGIMQIKPSTALGSPIFIEGVDADIASNIEAGIKYLRFIIDRYYANEPMDQLDKALFAVASYNAGPARIARLRKQAAELGFDPNKWFGHVEVIVSRDIGRETVQYVSNIYKYYVTYTLLMEQASVPAATDFERP